MASSTSSSITQLGKDKLSGTGGQAAKVLAKVGRIAQVNAGMGGTTLGSTNLQQARLIVMPNEQYGESDIWLAMSTSGQKGGQSDRRVLWCQFNPESITITKESVWAPQGSVKGEAGTETSFTYDQNGKVSGWATKPKNEETEGSNNIPTITWHGGKAAAFGLDLFFDTTNEPPASLGSFPMTESPLDSVDNPRDVRKYTNDLLALTLGRKSDNANRQVDDPPSVLFVWGNLCLFMAVVTEVQLTFALFDSDGTPVRARASVSFMQVDQHDDEFEDYWQNPTTRTKPKKTWIVQAGQTLHQIATHEYGHPAHWRHVAVSNQILNPMKLQPGQVLILPPLP